MSATERLYYHDSHLLEFDARVVEVSERDDGAIALTLDRTAFYPTGGGQPNDTGTLSDARVVDCIDAEADGVLHVIQGPVPQIGDPVHGTETPAAVIASYFVHVATYVRLTQLGFGYGERERRRIERLCAKATLALADRIPGASRPPSNLAGRLAGTIAPEAGVPGLARSGNVVDPGRAAPRVMPGPHPTS